MCGDDIRYFKSLLKYGSQKAGRIQQMAMDKINFVVGQNILPDKAIGSKKENQLIKNRKRPLY
jgi:hypothetical protein